MLGKGVPIVAQLFLVMFTYCGGEGSREVLVFLVALILFVCLRTVFKNPNKRTILDFVLMLSTCLSCTFTNCSLSCFYVTLFFLFRLISLLMFIMN